MFDVFETFKKIYYKYLIFYFNYNDFVMILFLKNKSHLSIFDPTEYNSMEFNIRKAKKADMSKVLDLIVELAIYEKEPEAVEISVEDLVLHGFG